MSRKSFAHIFWKFKYSYFVDRHRSRDSPRSTIKVIKINKEVLGIKPGSVIGDKLSVEVTVGFKVIMQYDKKYVTSFGKYYNFHGIPKPIVKI